MCHVYVLKMVDTLCFCIQFRNMHDYVKFFFNLIVKVHFYQVAAFWLVATNPYCCCKRLNFLGEVEEVTMSLWYELEEYGTSISGFAAICNRFGHYLQQFAATVKHLNWDPPLTLFAIQSCPCLPIFTLFSGFAAHKHYLWRLRANNFRQLSHL